MCLKYTFENKNNSRKKSSLVNNNILFDPFAKSIHFSLETLGT